MADDTLTDDDLWQIVRDRGPSLGALARCIAQLDAELRSARTRLAACRDLLDEITATQTDFHLRGVAAPLLSELVERISAELRAALGVDGD